MVRVATPANEPLLLEQARLTTAADLEKLCRKYALVQRHGQDPRPDDAQRRYVRRRDTEDGMVKIEAVLHPDEAELVWTMLDHAAMQLARQPGAAARDDSAEAKVAPSATPSPVLPCLAPPSSVPLSSVPLSSVPLSSVPLSFVPSSPEGAEVCATDDSAESRETLCTPAATVAGNGTASCLPRELYRIYDSAESRETSYTPAATEVGTETLSSAPGETNRIDDSAESRETALAPAEVSQPTEVAQACSGSMRAPPSAPSIAPMH